MSSPVRRWFKTIGALPFMEPGSDVDVWTNDIVGNLPQEMNEFASYFERTWIMVMGRLRLTGRLA